MNSNGEIQRINIRLPQYIQEWYKDQGKKYSVPYTNYMAMLLTQIYEQGKKDELSLELNQTLKEMQGIAGDVTAEEMINQMEQMKSMINDQ